MHPTQNVCDIVMSGMFSRQHQHLSSHLSCSRSGPIHSSARKAPRHRSSMTLNKYGGKLITENCFSAPHNTSSLTVWNLDGGETNKSTGYQILVIETSKTEITFKNWQVVIFVMCWLLIYVAYRGRWILYWFDVVSSQSPGTSQPVGWTGLSLKMSQIYNVQVLNCRCRVRSGWPLMSDLNGNYHGIFCVALETGPNC